MPNPVIATLLFLSSALLMLLFGSAMQFAHMQLGLIASELSCILLPALVGVFVARAREPAPRLSSIRRLGLSPGWLPWIVFTSVALGFAANALTGLISELVPGLQETASQYEETFQLLMYPDSPALRAAAIFAIVVVAPLSEEALFRGVMLPLQRDSERPLAAIVLLNAALFALIHFNQLSFIPLLIVGAWFAHLAVLSGSLWPSVIAHATLNFANGVVAPALLQVPAEALDPTVGEYLAAIALLAPIAAASWWLGARRLERKDA